MLLEFWDTVLQSLLRKWFLNSTRWNVGRVFVVVEGLRVCFGVDKDLPLMLSKVWIIEPWTSWNSDGHASIVQVCLWDSKISSQSSVQHLCSTISSAPLFNHQFSTSVQPSVQHLCSTISSAPLFNHQFSTSVQPSVQHICSTISSAPLFNHQFSTSVQPSVQHHCSTISSAPLFNHQFSTSVQPSVQQLHWEWLPLTCTNVHTYLSSTVLTNTVVAAA